ncbi:MAG TPA: ATP-binding cassette domain-containing protein, partial [Bacilli bacterium]|nr:ATP-binding cassette domain-containing protein [Bacilli bacterium]
EPYQKRKQIASKIGVVFGQKTQLWWDIPLIESFKVLKEIYQISDKDYQERLQFLFDVLSLDKFLSQPVRTLSLGQRMRADLAASLLHNPEILFLDEPTIGLDVLAKQKIREAIKAMNAKYKTTVILTTHDMNDIENLCSKVIMIEKGSIIYDGPLMKIKHKFGNIKTLVLSVNPDLDIGSVAKFDGDIDIKKEEDRVDIRFNADKIKLESVINYAFSVLKATDMKVSDISIEDVVKKILSEQEKGK